MLLPPVRLFGLSCKTNMYGLIFSATLSGLIGFCLLLGAPALSAQDLPHRLFTMQDGLPQQQVTCLLKDSRGYIWVGTKAGLAKFNGDRFEQIAFSAPKPQSYHIKRFFEDDSRNVWFSTPQGLGRYDGANVRFFPAPTDVEKIWPYDRQSFWVHCKNDKHYIFRKDRFIPIKELIPCFPGIKSMHFAKQPGAEAWLSNTPEQPLIWWKNCRLDTIRQQNKNISGITSFDGTLLIGTEEGANITYYTFKDGTLDLLLPGAPKGFITVHRINEKQVIYTPGRSGKVLLFNRQSKTTELIAADIPYTFAGQDQGMIADDNSYWFATEQGLLQLFRQGFRQVKHPELPYVWGIQEDRKGNLFFANYDGNLVQYDGREFRAVQENSARYFYFHPARNQKGDLYFPEAFGIVKKSGQNLKMITPDTVDQSNITRLYAFYDPLDNLVLAPGVKGTLWVIDSLDRCRVIQHTQGFHSEKNLTCVIRDHKDNYWIGSPGGLSRYHIPSQTLHYYLPEEGKLSVSSILCMAMDGSQRLWMGGFEGLGYWDHQGDSLVRVAPEVFSHFVENLTPVGDKWLVIGSVQGVFVLDAELFNRTGQVRMRQYNHRNGYLGQEPTMNGAFLDSKGRLWMPSSNDLSYIPIDELSLEKSLSNILITRINREKLPWNNRPEVYRLRRNVNEFSIHFEAIGFNQPIETQYAWKLEGFDDQFSDWSANNTAIYTHLKPGTYRFLVVVRDPALTDMGQMATTSIQVQVRMDFWRRPDFYWFAFLGLVILGAVALYYNYRNRQSQRAALEKERLLKYYQVQTLQAQLNPHFIFNLLQTIINRIRKDERRQAEDHLVQLGKMLRNFLDSSVESNLSESYGNRSQIPLSREIELLKMYLNLEQLQAPGAFEYAIEVDPGLYPDTTFLSPMIIQPFVENAVKHGLFYKQEPGRLWIRFRREDHQLICTVEDDGVGRAQAREIQSRSEKIYVSRGEELVKQRVKLLNELGNAIRIDVRDRPEGGTIVEVAFAEA